MSIPGRAHLPEHVFALHNAPAGMAHKRGDALTMAIRRRARRRSDGHAVS